MSESPNKLKDYLEEFGFEDDFVPKLLEELGDYEGLMNCTIQRMNEIFDFEKLKDDYFKNEEEDIEEEGEYDKDSFDIYVELFSDMINDLELTEDRQNFLNQIFELGVIEELARDLVRRFQNLENFKNQNFDEISKFIIETPIEINDIKKNASLKILREQYIQMQPEFEKNRWIQKIKVGETIKENINAISRLIHNLHDETRSEWEKKISNIENEVDFKISSYEVDYTPIVREKEAVLNKIIEQLEEDQKSINKGEWKLQEIPMKLEDSLISQIYIIDSENKLLKKRSKLNGILESHEYLSRVFNERVHAYLGFDKDLNSRDLVFVNEEALNHFKACVANTTFIWEKFNVDRNDNFTIEGSFDWHEQWKKINEYKQEKLEYDLIHASCYKQYEKEIFLDLKSTELKAELINRFIELNKIKNKKEFQSALVKIEEEFGALFDSGIIFLGGMFMITGRFEEPVPKEEYYEMEQYIFNKIKTEKKAELFEPGAITIPEDTIDAHIKRYDYKFKDDPEKEQRHRLKLKNYNKIKITNHCLGGGDFKTFRSFKNNITGCNQSWRVVEQELLWTYIGDLLTMPKTARKFLEGGVSGFDLLELKKRVWDDFRERTGNKFQSRVTDSLDMFDHQIQQLDNGKSRQPEQEVGTEKERIMNDLMTIYKNVFEDNFKNEIIENKIFSEDIVNIETYLVEEKTEKTEERIQQKLDIARHWFRKFSLFIDFVRSEKTLEDIQNEDGDDHKDLLEELKKYKKTGLEKDIWFEIHSSISIIKTQMEGLMEKVRPFLIDRNIGCKPGEDIIRRNHQLIMRDKQERVGIEVVTPFMRAWNCIAGKVDLKQFGKEPITIGFNFFAQKRDTTQKEIQAHRQRLFERKVQADLKPISWTHGKEPRKNQVQEKYEELLREHGESGGSILDLRRRMNGMFTRLRQQNLFDEDVSHELAHRLCAYLVLDTTIERTLLIKNVGKDRIRDFVDFYSEHRVMLGKKLKNRTPRFEDNLRKIFEQFSMSPEQIKKFSLYLYSNFIHMLSDEFLKEFVYPTREDEEEKNIIMNSPELREKLIASLEKLKTLQEEGKNVKRESEQTREDEYDPVRERAIYICNGKREFTYDKAMEVKLRKRENEIYQDRNMYKQIFDQMMIRNKLRLLELDSGIPVMSTAETALAIYYLADANLKRIFVNNFYQSNTPIPLLFPNSRAYLAPINALSLMYKDPNGNNIKLNPYFHPSAKWCFFQTREMIQSVERVANVMFFKGNHFFPKLDKKDGTIENGTTYASIISNKNESPYSKIAQLNIVLMNNYYFERISVRERFILTISKVTIMLRKEGEDEQKIQEVYNFIKRHNDDPRNKQKKMLIELVQYRAKQKREKICFFHPENWYMTLYVHGRSDLDKDYVREFIRGHQFGRDFGMNLAFPEENSKPERQHYSLKEDVERCRDMGIWFDMEQAPMKQIWEDIIDLVEPMSTGETGVLKLQDGLYKEYHENEVHMLDIKITKNKREKNKMFSDQMKNARIKQLEYISSLADDSPVMKFLNVLIKLKKMEQVTYLVNLEAYLEYKKILDIFEVDQEQHLQSVNFFREMNQIYEVLRDFIDHFRDDESEELLVLKDRIRVLPQIVAELFWNWYPLELINGDLTVIPVDWLKAVLDEIKSAEPIKDAKMTVLTVMGAQNGGKSTFLNSLFNMTFRVFSGRTTRGAKAVMIKVDRESFPEFWQKEKDDEKFHFGIRKPTIVSEKFKKKMEFIPEYLMILDTEGLGSIDQICENLRESNSEEKVHIRDNRLILMNSGLSNFCIINSMKEINKRILDILSMLMYSYARLSEFKIGPPLNMVFQDRDYNDYQYNNLYKTSIENLELIYKNLKIDNPNIDLPRFRDLLKFYNGKDKDIKMLAGFGKDNDYSDRYVDAIENYKKMIFSTEFIFKKENMQDIESFKHRMGHLYNVVTYDTANFNAQNFIKLNLERVHKIFEFKLEHKIGIMFEKRLKDFGIKSWDELMEKEEDLLTDIENESTKYASLRDFVTEARNKKYIDESKGSDHPKFRALSKKAFNSFQKEYYLRSQALKASQLDLEGLYDEHINSIPKQITENVTTYRELKTEFEKKYKECEEKIKKEKNDNQKKLKDNLQVVNTIDEKFQEKESHEKFGKSLVILRQKYNELKKKDDNNICDLISEEIKNYNFENYLKLIKFDPKLLQENIEFTNEVKRELSFEKIFKFEKNERIFYDLNYFQKSIESLDEIFMGKGDSRFRHSNWLIEGKIEIGSSHQTKNMEFHYMYRCFQMLYLFHRLYMTSKIITQTFLTEIETKFKNFENEKPIVEFEYISRCGLTDDQKLSFYLFVAIKESIRLSIQKQINEEFEKSINNIFLKYTSPTNLVNELKIDLLKEHFEAKDSSSDEAKSRFVEKLLINGSDFRDMAEKKINDVINEKSNLVLYRESITEKLLKNEKEIIQKIEDESFFEYREKVPDERMRTMMLKIEEYNSDNVKEEVRNLFESEDWKDEIKEYISIQNKEILKSKYLENTKLRMKPCDGCGAVCISEDADGDEAFFNNNHLPLILRGIRIAPL